MKGYLIVLASLILIMAGGKFIASKMEKDRDAPARMPRITLINKNNKPVSLEELTFSGSVLLYVDPFGGNFCTCDYGEALAKFPEIYDGFIFGTVISASPDKISQREQVFGFPWDAYFDEHKALGKRYNLHNKSAILLINREGQLVASVPSQLFGTDHVKALHKLISAL